MATGPEQDGEQTENKGAPSTPQLDRLENLAKAAAAAAQAKQWRPRENGLQEQEEPSEVWNLSHDTCDGITDIAEVAFLSHRFRPAKETSLEVFDAALKGLPLCLEGA